MHQPHKFGGAKFNWYEPMFVTHDFLLYIFNEIDFRFAQSSIFPSTESFLVETRTKNSTSDCGLVKKTVPTALIIVEARHDK